MLRWSLLCDRSCAEIVSALSSLSGSDKYADAEREQQDLHLMKKEAEEWVRLGRLLLETLKTGHPEQPAQEEKKVEEKDGEVEKDDQKTSEGGEVQDTMEMEGKLEKETETETKTSTSSKVRGETFVNQNYSTSNMHIYPFTGL